MGNRGCVNHPGEPAAVTCTSCGRSLCRACWRRNVDGRPWCELCIHHVTSIGSNLPFAIAFAMLSASFATIGWRWEALEPRHHYVFWYCFAVASCAAAISFATLKRGALARTVELRADDDARPLAVGPDARRWRSIAFRATRLVASPVSGRATAMVLLGCMLCVGFAVPELLHLPRWLEIEGVIAGWWGVWTIALSVLLYRGWRLSDDHVLAPPRAPWRVQTTRSTEAFANGHPVATPAARSSAAAARR